MDLTITDYTLMAKNMVKVYSIGLMEVVIKANLTPIIQMGMVSMIGEILNLMMANGKTIK